MGFTTRPPRFLPNNKLWSSPHGISIWSIPLSGCSCYCAGATDHEFDNELPQGAPSSPISIRPYTAALSTESYFTSPTNSDAHTADTQMTLIFSTNRRTFPTSLVSSDTSITPFTTTIESWFAMLSELTASPLTTKRLLSRDIILVSYVQGWSQQEGKCHPYYVKKNFVRCCMLGGHSA